MRRRSNVGFVCLVEDVRATLGPQSFFLVVRRRLTQLGSALSAESQGNALCTAHRRCPRMRARIGCDHGKWRSDIFFRNKLETWEKIPQYIKSAACISTECHISPSGYLLISRTLCTDCTSKTVDTYGLGEFCRSGTKVDDLFVLHVQIWDVASVRMLAAALTLSLGRISALRQASEMLIV